MMTFSEKKEKVQKCFCEVKPPDNNYQSFALKKRMTKCLLGKLKLIKP